MWDPEVARRTIAAAQAVATANADTKKARNQEEVDKANEAEADRITEGLEQSIVTTILENGMDAPVMELDSRHFVSGTDFLGVLNTDRLSGSAAIVAERCRQIGFKPRILRQSFGFGTGVTYKLAVFAREKLPA